MDDLFSLGPGELQKLAAAEELRTCNDFTARFGLTLTEAQIWTLVEKKSEALKDTGRVEFGGGILKKLIWEFCDSPFITQDNYEETLSELLDSFYYFKNESMDIISDDELISLMKEYFDTVCQGSLEYMSGTALDDLCRSARNGGTPRRLF